MTARGAAEVVSGNGVAVATSCPIRSLRSAPPDHDPLICVIAKYRRTLINLVQIAVPTT
jgi:hypothetical protein